MSVVDTAQELSNEVELETASSSAPVVIRPRRFGVDLIRWASQSVGAIEGLLRHHGAVIFRGFKINGSGHLEKLIASMYQRDLLEYGNRSTPAAIGAMLLRNGFDSASVTGDGMLDVFGMKGLCHFAVARKAA